MQVEAKHMVRLVHNLLELGRLETRADVDLRPLDFLSLVEELLGQFRLQAEPSAPSIGPPDCRAERGTSDFGAFKFHPQQLQKGQRC